MREYTPRIKGFQIRDCVYIGKPPKDTIEYDIIKWEKYDKPQKIYDLETNEIKEIEEYCYSVATLEWDSKEGEFDFNSVGLRWLECNPPKEFISEIISFAENRRKEILYELENK